MSIAMPDLVEDTEISHEITPDTPWETILWDDDVNSFSYVTGVLQKVLEKDHETCEKLTWKVDAEGRASVFNGTKDEAQETATKLSAACLWATVEKS